MPYIIGIILALGVAVFGRATGFDRGRSFYPTVLMVVASYYGLFAVMGGSTTALIAECGIVVVFTLLAWLGFKYSAWLLVAGLAAHGVFDFFHAHLITNPGVPSWWPPFCLSYDVAAAVFLGWLILRTKEPRAS